MWPKFKAWFQRQSTGRQYAVVIAAIVAVFALIGAASGGDQGSKTSSSGGDASVSPSQATTKDQKRTSAPPRPPSTREQIRKLVDHVDPGDKVRAVDFSRVGSKLRVVVEFDLSDNLTRGLRRAGVENDMRDVYKAVYTAPAGRKVRSMELQAWTALVDRFGKESQGSAFTTALDDETAAQVNWDNADVLNFNHIWLQLFKLPDF